MENILLGYDVDYDDEGYRDVNKYLYYEIYDEDADKKTLSLASDPSQEIPRDPDDSLVIATLDEILHNSSLEDNPLLFVYTGGDYFIIRLDIIRHNLELVVFGQMEEQWEANLLGIPDYVERLMILGRPYSADRERYIDSLKKSLYMMKRKKIKLLNLEDYTNWRFGTSFDKLIETSRHLNI